MSMGVGMFLFGLAGMMVAAAGEMLLLALLGYLAEFVPKDKLKRMIRWFGG